MVRTQRDLRIAILSIALALVVLALSGERALADEAGLRPTAPADAASVAALATALLDATAPAAQTASSDVAQIRSQVAFLQAQGRVVRAEIVSLDPSSARRDPRLGRDEREVVVLSAESGTLPIGIASDARAEAVALRAYRTSLAARETTVAGLASILSDLASRIALHADALERARTAARALLAAPTADPQAALASLDAVTRDAQVARSALVADTAVNVGLPLAPISAWSWPVAGPITQGFGPTTIAVEPARGYGGPLYPHFHDAIDIGSPLSAPVVAATAGRVTFVGHFSDGAMVVQIADTDGLVETYAHLDDRVLPPPVRVGDAVSAGQRIGSVGLTGVTSGAHLHFAVYRGATPLDPLLLLPPQR